MDTNQPRLAIFASGTKDGGGSGVENLCRRDLPFAVDVRCIISEYEHGGVRRIADRYGIHFVHFPAPWTRLRYQEIAFRKSGADFFALSGWLHMTEGLPPERTFNIHPGPLPRFGGKGMYGHRVHEAVLAAYQRGEITESEVCMHFVSDDGKYDTGPIIARSPVEILPEDTVESLKARVKECEHLLQRRITKYVMNGLIRWENPDDPSTIMARLGYSITHKIL